MAAKTNRFEYWKTGDQRFKQVFNEEEVIAQQALAKEKRALVKELLGTDLEEKFDVAPWNPLNEMLDFLALPRRIEVMEIEQRFTAKRMKLLGAGIVAGLDHLLKDVENERDAEVARLLSPNEQEDYQLRRSEIANKVAWELTGFEPSEKEFRDIFKIRKQIEDEFGTARNGILGSAATAKMDEQLKSLLGDSRYAEYERSQDSTYQAARRVADNNGFDKDAANKIYELKKAAEAQANVVRQDDSLTREQRSAALSAIRKEADDTAHALFSHEAILALEGQGAWLGHIARPATPAHR